MRSLTKFCFAAMLAALFGTITMSEAAAGVGYYYSAPSYYVAPPVYGPSPHLYGYYSGPGYYGGLSSPLGTSTYYSGQYYGAGVYNYGYPAYGYISPYRYYGYRPQRFGYGRGLYDFDD